MTEPIKTPWDKGIRAMEGRPVLALSKQEIILWAKAEGYRRAVEDLTCPFCGRLRWPAEDCACMVAQSKTVGGDDNGREKASS